MLVFHSWSGPRSKAVAEAFAAFLSQVIQAVEPWLSQDIAKGTRWNAAISDQLEKTRVGISVLTPENLHGDWILFEAGAMSKIKSGLVCTLLIGLKPADVEEPLAQFQHTLPEREDVKRLVAAINAAVKTEGERSLPDAALEKAFNTNWPELAAAFEVAKKAPSAATEPKRSERDLLEEILEHVRRPASAQQSLSDMIASASIGEAGRGFTLKSLLDSARANAAAGEGGNPHASSLSFSNTPTSQPTPAQTLAALKKLERIRTTKDRKKR